MRWSLLETGNDHTELAQPGVRCEGPKHSKHAGSGFKGYTVFVAVSWVSWV